MTQIKKLIQEYHFNNVLLSISNTDEESEIYCNKSIELLQKIADTKATDSIDILRKLQTLKQEADNMVDGLLVIMLEGIITDFINNNI